MELTLFHRLDNNEFNIQDRHIIEEACELAKTDPFDAMRHMMQNLLQEFHNHRDSYQAAFYDLNHRARRNAYSQGRLHRQFYWPNSFLGCSSVLKQFVNRWVVEELPRKVMAKCLILIGPGHTGKTAFAMSLPGFYNFMVGPWSTEDFNPYADYTIYAYIHWDHFRQHGYPDKKLLFLQPGRIHTTNSHGSPTVVDVLQPAIILLHTHDQGSLANVPSTNDVLSTTHQHFWNKHAYIYRIKANEWDLKNYYIAFNDDQYENRIVEYYPSYISFTNTNFKMTFSSELNNMDNPIDINVLQQLNFLVHQLSLIHLHQELWHHCLDACRGQLKPTTSCILVSTSSVDIEKEILSFYPNIVTNIMKYRRIIHDNQNQYIDFIENYLQQLANKHKEYQLEYNDLQKQIESSTYYEVLNTKIMENVQKHGLEMIKIHFQIRINLIKCMGIDRWYQYNFFQQKPTIDQLEIAKNICMLTLEKEQAEQELIQFKFGVLFKKYPRILRELITYPLPSLITMISDANIREHLSKEYHLILQRTQEDLLGLYTQAYDFKKIDCENIFNMKTDDIWQRQQKLCPDEQLDNRMRSLIEQRQKNIIIYMKIIYELRDDLSDDLLYSFAVTMDDNNQIIDEEEQSLTQTFSQQRIDSVSVTNKSNRRTPPPSISPFPKKMKNDQPDMNTLAVDEIIPQYLALDSFRFQKFIQSFLATTANPFTQKDIQDMALILRQIMITQLQMNLFDIYLQSGTGKLGKNDHSSPSINTLQNPLFLWPLEIKSTLSQTSNVDHNTCLTYVNQILDQYTNQLRDYERKIQNKKLLLNDLFTFDMETILMDFIEEQELRQVQIRIQSKIAIIKYDYQDELIDRKYNQLQKPTDEQLALWKNLLEVKEEKEKSNYELALWKQRFHNRHLPDVLKSLQLPIPSALSFDLINDTRNRRILTDRYKRINEQMKSELMAFYITIAEMKMNECLFRFNEHMTQMKASRQFNTFSMNLIEERFKSIDERFEYLYQLKMRIFNQQKPI
ncbi:hypothetical protein I4U23_010829 [Adineta vaga]|nr:hypothetical protein I4U23_010829 [Adineta vaga]